jgi:Flp pilus assembly protein TadD
VATALHEAWAQSPSEADWQEFDQAVQAFLSSHPQSAAAQLQAGIWYLAGFRTSGRRDDCDSAVACLERATELYPHDSFIRAQLAWTLHVRGDARASLRQARRALALDAQTSHAERKLAGKRIVDPGAAEELSALGLSETASVEEVMRYLTGVRSSRAGEGR